MTVPAVVILQSIKVWEYAVRIIPIGHNKVGIPVQTLDPVVCRTGGAPVRLPVAHVTVVGCYGGRIHKQWHYFKV